jgi:hypothetical protein
MRHARPALSGPSPPLCGRPHILSQPSAPKPRVLHEVLGMRGFLLGAQPFEAGSVRAKTPARRPNRSTREPMWAACEWNRVTRGVHVRDTPVTSGGIPRPERLEGSVYLRLKSGRYRPLGSFTQPLLGQHAHCFIDSHATGRLLAALN